ncbi:hypothetical protein ACJJTC_003066 [Scirpophaga incertulas]
MNTKDEQSKPRRSREQHSQRRSLNPNDSDLNANTAEAPHGIVQRHARPEAVQARTTNMPVAGTSRPAAATEPTPPVAVAVSARSVEAPRATAPGKAPAMPRRILVLPSIDAAIARTYVSPFKTLGLFTSLTEHYPVGAGQTFVYAKFPQVSWQARAFGSRGTTHAHCLQKSVPHSKSQAQPNGRHEFDAVTDRFRRRGRKVQGSWPNDCEMLWYLCSSSFEQSSIHALYRLLPQELEVRKTTPPKKQRAAP